MLPLLFPPPLDTYIYFWTIGSISIYTLYIILVIIIKEENAKCWEMLLLPEISSRHPRSYVIYPRSFAIDPIAQRGIARNDTDKSDIWQFNCVIGEFAASPTRERQGFPSLFHHDAKIEIIDNVSIRGEEVHIGDNIDNARTRTCSHALLKFLSPPKMAGNIFFIPASPLVATPD